MSSQRLTQQTQGLHWSTPGFHKGYCSNQLCIFMGFLTVRTSGSLILVPALWTLSSCWFTVSNFNMIGFAFCCILCYFIMLGCYLLETCSFLMRHRKGSQLGREGRKEELGTAWSRGRGNYQDILYQKKVYCE